MKTVTLSMRLPGGEVERFAHAAALSGMDRSAFFKQALRRGVRDLMLEQAADAYRRGAATLSRAAEMAGLTLREFLVRMQSLNLEMNYSPDDLDKDIAP
jgi:predicted HTH domain antitoxin